jgi:hypothetical protein
MATTAPIDIDLWISDEELAELAVSLERIVTRSRLRPLTDRAAFFADYVEAE